MATTLDPDDHVYVVQCGLQIFKHGFVLTPELLDVLIELSLRSADLLRNQIGAVLQVVTDVTHRCPPFPIRLQETKSDGSSGQFFGSRRLRRDVTFQQRTDPAQTLSHAAEV